MGLFPQSFIDELRQHADIVQVIEAVTPLKKAGTSYKGLCPFHAEKTPSFHVNRERGFFKCFGCGAGGDVFKFVELHERLAFPEAVRHLAQRFGMPVPEPEDRARHEAVEGEREALLKMHELAAAYFREQLARPAAASARRFLEDRGIVADTAERLGLGYAPSSRSELLERLAQAGFPRPLVLRSGLAVARDDGTVLDRFRNRLMIPICRESGAVIAFGGRALEEGQQPKYLNSPETPIYTKGRVLYGLHLSKSAIRQLNFAVIVEGYFDFAQLQQGGIRPVVASCGTALTPQQAQLLRRFAGKVVISFDPDAAGQSAAARSCDLLVSEGFQVNVATLPPGLDPDGFVQRHGSAAYGDRLKNSQPYLDYLLDRAVREYDLGSDEGRHAFLTAMLTVAARIPDAAARDQFGDRLAHRAHVTEEVVRAEIRKAAVGRRTSLTARELPTLGEIRPAEKGLLWALVHEPEAGMAALSELDEADVAGLKTAGILQTAKELEGWEVSAVPSTLLERLTPQEAALLSQAAEAAVGPARADDCAKVLKRLRYERERAAVQVEIDRFQAAPGPGENGHLEILWSRKLDLMHRIEALKG